MLGFIRLVHPAPAASVVGLSAVLAAILSTQAGNGIGPRAALISLSVLGSQVMTGALNDWADRARDAVVQRAKPIPAGQLTPNAALAVAVAGLALQVGTSAALGALTVVLGMAAAGGAVAYNLWLSRTVLSFAPYLVSFGMLPIWIASGVGAPLERVTLAPLLVGPFAVAAHLANTWRDFDADARVRSGNLAQRLGRDTAFTAAWSVALGVGLAAGVALVLTGRADGVSLVLGAVGAGAIANGALRAPHLWNGMLVAAVSWTAAWALASA